MRTSRSEGFALPAVLAVTGVVTLIFLVAITALANLTAEAKSAQARVKFVQSALTAEARLAYLAATEPLSVNAIAIGQPRAIDEFSASLTAHSKTDLRLDDHPYLTTGEYPLLVSIQDEAGMVNLAGLNDDQMSRFASALGLPDAMRRSALQLYLDYVDQDSLVRQGGAEQSEYGRERIANRQMLRPSEWLSLLGMRSTVRPELWRAVEPYVAVDRSVFQLNVNTASAFALKILFGVTEQQADAAIRARQLSPFLSLDDFNAASGASVADDGEHRYTFPSGNFVYTVRDTRSAWTYRARLSLTPGGSEMPLWIDQTELKEATPNAASRVSDATPFPDAFDRSSER